MHYNLTPLRLEIFMKHFILSLCFLMLCSCATSFVEDIGKDDLIDFDTDKIIAIGKFKDNKLKFKDTNEFIVIGEKYVYQPTNALSNTISQIPNKSERYTVLTDNVDIVIGLNGVAQFQKCFYLKINDFTQSFCGGSANEMKIYKKTFEVENQYAIKTNINVHLKSKNKAKEMVSKTLRPFATVLDLMIFPVYIIGNDWN